MNTAVVGMGIAACVIICCVWWAIEPKIKLPKLGEYKNKRKEKKLLNVILKDMKKNGGNWLLQRNDRSMDGNLIVNDKTNMAIRYGKEGVTVYFNLKDIATLEPDSANTLITTIRSKQATKFVNKAIRILDHRGKELAYFTQRIKERL